MKVNVTRRIRQLEQDIRLLLEQREAVNSLTDGQKLQLELLRLELKADRNTYSRITMFIAICEEQGDDAALVLSSFIDKTIIEYENRS